MWFFKVTSDYSNIPDMIEYYEKELESASVEVKLRGHLEKQIANLPGITEYRYNQLQEIEAILKHLENDLLRIKSVKFKKYTEHYNKALTSRDAEKYSESEPDVVAQKDLLNQVAFLRNKYLGIFKGLEAKSFMVGHITRLRSAGMSDIYI